MRRLSGFSLMEMMTVLLIVSVVAAASAPMINKKAVSSVASKSPWLRLANSESIAFNISGNDTTSAIIGATKAPEITVDKEKYVPKLHIASKIAPHITLEDKSDNSSLAKIFFKNKSIGISNVDPGVGATTIGYGTTTGRNAVAVGMSANASGNSSTAISENATASSENSIAIGLIAKVDSDAKNSLAFGYGSWVHSNSSNSVAIGRIAETVLSNSIAIGNLAMAGSGTDNSASGRDAIAIGSQADAKGDYTLAIGSGVSAVGADSVAVGRTVAEGSRAIALGKHSFTNLYSGVPSDSIAIGTDAVTEDTNSIAIGLEAWTTADRTVALGERANAKSGETSALGYYATVSENSFGSTAVGTEAIVDKNARYSTAIGYKAKAAHANSTAIGANATTYSINQIALGTANDTVYIPGNLVVGGRFAVNTDDIWYKKNDKYIGLSNTIKVQTYVNGSSALIDSLGTKTVEELDFLNNAISDRRLKNVGKAFVGGLAELKKLDLFHYTYKKDESKTPHVGVMAQDLQKVFPNAVTKGDDGFLRIRMEDMFYALVNAVKELAGMFDSHDKRIVQLEKENKQLQKLVSDLEKRLAKLEK